MIDVIIFKFFQVAVPTCTYRYADTRRSLESLTGRCYGVGY
jgi:hypothetical protein